MGLIAGNLNYLIYCCLSIGGTVGAETPDTSDDYVKFFAEDYDRPVVNLVQPKPSIAKSIYYPASKFSIDLTLKNISITPQGANTATTEADAIDDFMMQNGIKRGSQGGFYIFLYNEAEAQYRKWAWNSNLTQVRTIKMAPIGWNDVGGKGKIYNWPSFKFMKSE